jgi:hypothetical protein
MAALAAGYGVAPVNAAPPFAIVADSVARGVR